MLYSVGGCSLCCCCAILCCFSVRSRTLAQTKYSLSQTSHIHTWCYCFHSIVITEICEGFLRAVWSSNAWFVHDSVNGKLWHLPVRWIHVESQLFIYHFISKLHPDMADIGWISNDKVYDFMYDVRRYVSCTLFCWLLDQSCNLPSQLHFIKTTYLT